MASAQLQLIETDRPWKLDRRTVEIGRAGVARARAALAASTTGAPSGPSAFEGSARTSAPHQAAA